MRLCKNPLSYVVNSSVRVWVLYLKSFVPPKFPRPALSVFDFPVSRKMRLKSWQRLLLFSYRVLNRLNMAAECGSACCYVWDFICFIKMALFRNEKNWEENHPITLSDFAYPCYELGVELRWLQFRWVASLGRKSQLLIFLNHAWPQVWDGERINIYLPVEQLIGTINLRTRTSCETMSWFRHALY